MNTPSRWPALYPAVLLILSISCAPTQTAAVAPEPATPAPSQASAGDQHRPPTRQEVYRYLPEDTNSLGTEALLSEICKQAAGKVYYQMKDKENRQQTARVAVVSAVPLSDLKRDTEFGRLVAEYLLTDLADRGVRVTELRLGKEITILPQTGEFVMTRNQGELAGTSFPLDYVVVSTFSNTPKNLILQGRLVRLRDGLVETSWRNTLPLTRDLLSLFGEAERPFAMTVKGVR